MARFCEKHMGRAVDTLKSYKTGTEYDLCAICLDELDVIMNGESKLSNSDKELLDEAFDSINKGEIKTFNNADDLIAELNTPGTIKEGKSGRKRATGRPKTAKK